MLRAACSGASPSHYSVELGSNLLTPTAKAVATDADCAVDYSCVIPRDSDGFYPVSNVGFCGRPP